MNKLKSVKSLGILRLAVLAQLGLATICVLVSLTWFPGVMLLIPLTLSLVYLFFSIHAFTGSIFSMRSALVVSVIVGVLCIAGTNRFVSAGFDYLTGATPSSTSPPEPQYVIGSTGTSILIEGSRLIASPPPVSWDAQIRDRMPYIFLVGALLSMIVLAVQVICLFSAEKSRRFGL